MSVMPPKVTPELGVYTLIRKPLASCAECIHVVSRKSVSSFDMDSARKLRKRGACPIQKQRQREKENEREEE